jgi:hypothetical protein
MYPRHPFGTTGCLYRPGRPWPRRRFRTHECVARRRPLEHIRDVFTIPPLRIFARGAQLHVPILVGSNEFRAYPVNSDSDVPPQYRQWESDTFAYGALSIARATTQARQKAYLYCFTYADTGHRAPLGAHHGEELFFLSDTYPSDWQPRRPDRELAKLVRGYWCSSQAT